MGLFVLLHREIDCRLTQTPLETASMLGIMHDLWTGIRKDSYKELQSATYSAPTRSRRTPEVDDSPSPGSESPVFLHSVDPHASLRVRKSGIIRDRRHDTTRHVSNGISPCAGVESYNNGDEHYVSTPVLPSALSSNVGCSWFELSSLSPQSSRSPGADSLGRVSTIDEMRPTNTETEPTYNDEALVGTWADGQGYVSLRRGRLKDEEGQSREV
ncbi:hypothetical protein LA080_003602 [Diaporthe eres]|nr:hypothetical protein LA080_003602 [Diaporthe eres]